jgi:hypothetical protein
MSRRRAPPVLASSEERDLVVTLIEQVEEKVRQATHGCIRHLVVREERGRILVQGQTPTQYAKQLALCGALQFVSGERLRAEITVG